MPSPAGVQANDGGLAARLLQALRWRYTKCQGSLERFAVLTSWVEYDVLGVAADAQGSQHVLQVGCWRRGCLVGSVQLPGGAPCTAAWLGQSDLHVGLPACTSKLLPPPPPPHARPPAALTPTPSSAPPAGPQSVIGTRHLQAYEQLVRLLNAIASDRAGRAYLMQQPALVCGLLLQMLTHHEEAGQQVGGSQAADRSR
jgi:hypothetical protein